MGHAAAIGRTAPWGTDAEKCRQRRLLRGRGVQLQGTRSLRADAVGAQLREIDVPATVRSPQHRLRGETRREAGSSGHAVAIGARPPWAHGCRKEAAVKAAAGERSSGGYTRRYTDCLPGAGAATDGRSRVGPSTAGRALRRSEAVSLNAKRACNDPSPPAFRP